MMFDYSKIDRAAAAGYQAGLVGQLLPPQWACEESLLMDAWQVGKRLGVEAAALLTASKPDPMIRAMSNPKMDKALRALVVIDRAAVSSVDLAQVLGVSRPTAVRLVESLRDFGCQIASERDGHDYWYRLNDWGVFDPTRVKKYVGDLKDSGQRAPTGSAP